MNIRIPLLLITTLVACSRTPKEPETNAPPSSGGGASSELQEPTEPEGGAPRILYDRGEAQPKALAAHDDSLFWTEWEPQGGRRVMWAPADGSKEPEKIGEAGSIDLTTDVVSAGPSHVCWQNNGKAVLFDRKEEAASELTKELKSGGGPCVISAERWAVFASPSCRHFVIRDLKSGETSTTEFDAEIIGLTTSLGVIGDTAYCANGPHVVSVELTAGSASSLWQTDDPDWYLTQLETQTDSLLLEWGHGWNGSTSLQRLSLDGAKFEEIATLEASAIRFATQGEELFYGGWAEPAPLVHHGKGTLPGQAAIGGKLVQSEGHLFWAENEGHSNRETTKNAIYVQDLR